MKKSLSTVAVALLVGLGGSVVTSDNVDAQGRRSFRGQPSAPFQAYRPQYRPQPVYRPQYGYRRSNTGRNVAIGVGAAVIGTIIATEAARAASRDRQYYVEEPLSCGQLERRCDAGGDWACRELDRRGDC